MAANRNGFRNDSSQILRIAKVKLHPEYSCNKLENDIALLELETEILWTNADPACFPNDESSFTNLTHVKAVAVGWGATNEDLSIGR